MVVRCDLSGWVVLEGRDMPEGDKVVVGFIFNSSIDTVLDN